MIKPSLEIGRVPSGGYKLYLTGQHDDHIMDWAGCNYRYKVIEGQPLRGFHTLYFVEEFQRKFIERFPPRTDILNGHIDAKFGFNREEFEKWARMEGSGTHMNDSKFVDMFIGGFQ